MADLHPVKHETFDVLARQNVDPKGFIRQVDEYCVSSSALYMARGADHPKFGYLESWLLPKLNLRANIFHFRPELCKEFEYYFDIAHITREGNIWHTRDLYVDLVCVADHPVEVLDIDELAIATTKGLISASDAELAIGATLHAVEGITRYGDDPMAWLEAEGYPLQWAHGVTLKPVGSD